MIKVIIEDIYHKRSCRMTDNLSEAKADTQKLIDFAGEDLANRFLAIKNRLKSPENDLYYWIKNKTVDELEDFVTDIENTESKSQKSKNIADQGAKLILNTPHWKVYHISTFEASQKYGRDTKWCITGSDGYGDKYWREYTDDDGVEFYFLITKGHYDPRGKYSKIAIAMYPDDDDEMEIFNQQDEKISHDEIPYYKELKELPRIGALFSDPVTDLVIEPGTTKITSETIKFFKDKIESVTIPDSVTMIGGGAFFGCESLKNITIPDSVKSIGTGAFSSCKSLTSIDIPDSVTSISDWAFSSCTSLKNITIPDSVTMIGGTAFFGCGNLTITCSKGSYAEEYAIQNNIPVKVI